MVNQSQRYCTKCGTSVVHLYGAIIGMCSTPMTKVGWRGSRDPKLGGQGSWGAPPAGNLGTPIPGILSCLSLQPHGGWGERHFKMLDCGEPWGSLQPGRFTTLHCSPQRAAEQGTSDIPATRSPMLRRNSLIDSGVPMHSDGSTQQF